MTVQEAIKYVVKEVCEDCCGSDEPMGDCKTCGVKIALECMEEVEQYRALGTVEELKGLKELNKNCTIEQLTGVECSYNETGCSDCKGKQALLEAIEKQIPKKPIEDCCCGCHRRCPNCGEYFDCDEDYHLENGEWKYCGKCGQAIDWGEEDEPMSNSSPRL